MPEVAERPTVEKRETDFGRLCHILGPKGNVALCGYWTTTEVHEASFLRSLCEGCGRPKCRECLRLELGL